MRYLTIEDLIDKKIKMAQQCIKENMLSEASEIMEAVYLLNPNDKDVLNIYGKINLQFNRLELAKDIYLRANKLYPEEFEGGKIFFEGESYFLYKEKINLALELLEKDNFKEALIEIDESLEIAKRELDIDVIDLYLIKFLICHKLKNKKEKKNIYKKVISIDKNNRKMQEYNSKFNRSFFG